MPSSARGGPAEEAAFVAKKRQSWLAGLAKGLTLAGRPEVDPAAVWFPYYGNRFADAVAAREAADCRARTWRRTSNPATTRDRPAPTR
jgi:hypothetical protein